MDYDVGCYAHACLFASLTKTQLRPFPDNHTEHDADVKHSSNTLFPSHPPTIPHARKPPFPLVSIPPPFCA